MEVKKKNGKFIIEFDKAPKFLYFNENGDGCGQVYTDGERFMGIQRVKIEAETRTAKPKVCFRFSIQHILGEMQPDGRLIPTIAITGNMNETVREVK